MVEKGGAWSSGTTRLLRHLMRQDAVLGDSGTRDPSTPVVSPTPSGERAGVARRLGLDLEADRTRALARAGYGHLPDGSPVWLRRLAGSTGREVERLTPDLRARIGACLRDDRGVELAADARGASTITHPDR